VQKTLGLSVQKIVERARKPAPEKVLEAWAAEWAKEKARKWTGRSYFHPEDSGSSHVGGRWNALLPGSLTTEG
jgi:hypothetical protein